MRLSGFWKSVYGKSAARRRLMAMLSLLFVATAGSAVADDLDQVFVRADGLVVYFAAVPSAFALGHPADHTGREMHRNAPDGRYLHHLMVAVFDSATGVRITNADVTAVVQGAPKPSDGRVRLESMAVGGAQAYGGLATLPPRHRYRIEIEVVRPGAAPVRATFMHQHLQP
ncbi:MAG: hypothetical protein HYX37_12960 [Rhizobiales bacterium]|nr:hypothetical protein [Hyphomicrobiales bacterium]